MFTASLEPCVRKWVEGTEGIFTASLAPCILKWVEATEGIIIHCKPRTLYSEMGGGYAYFKNPRTL